MKLLMATVGLAAGLLAQQAHAEIVTFQFTGVITGLETSYELQFTPHDAFAVDGRRFALGQTYSGSISYSMQAKVGYEDPEFIRYDGPADLDFNFPASGLALASDADAAFFSVSNGAPNESTDRFSMLSRSGRYSLQFGLQDMSGNAFADNSVPVALDLEDFASATTGVSVQSSNPDMTNYHIYGRLTSLTRVSPVPEPSAAWLLLGGLGVIGARRYARRG